MLCKDLKTYTKEGYRVLVLSASATRDKRMCDDLMEYGILAFFSEDNTRTINPGEVMLLKGSLGVGAKYPDQKYVILTEGEKMLLTLHEPPSRWVAVLTDKEGRAWGGTYRRETDSFRFSDGRGGQAETAETVQLSTHFPLEDWLLKLICTYRMGETPSVQALELIQSSRAGGAPAFHWLAEKGDTWHCRFYLMNDEPVVWTEYEQPTGENVQ